MKERLKKIILIGFVFVVLVPILNVQAATNDVFVVKSGQNINNICDLTSMRTSQIKAYNGFTTNKLKKNQRILTFPNVKYVVRKGDTLSKIAKSYKTTVARLKSINRLKSNTIKIGANLIVPIKTPKPVLYWPSRTYVVKPGDTVSSIAKKHNTSVNNILKYNYMKIHEWLNAGEKIAINGYAPRYYSAIARENYQQTKYGKLVDWFFDGKYLIRRNNKFAVTDLATGKYIKLKMMGGYNHIDVEPQRKTDTNKMKQLWPRWNWKPRPVIIHIRGMNIAASLSGMPHSFDTIPTNGVTGHFDLYLFNSKSHSKADQNYAKQHTANVRKAANIK